MKAIIRASAITLGIIFSSVVLHTVQAQNGTTNHGHGQGLVYATAPDFDRFSHVRIGRSIDINQPTHLELRDYLPPVGDQGKTGACSSWSTAYYCVTAAVGKNQRWTQEQLHSDRFRFSPAFVWHQFNQGRPDVGMPIFEAMDVLAKQGCCTLAEMPWREHDVTSQPSAGARMRAAQYKASRTVNLFRGAKYGEPATPLKLRTWLWETKLPIVIGIDIFDDFLNLPKNPDYIYHPMKGHARGGHALCIVGYDENKHAFLAVNSWGTGWGNHGFVWLDEDYIVRFAREGWGLTIGGPKARLGDDTEPVQIKNNLFVDPPVHGR